MYCGNGYSFSEYFKPLIEELADDCEIELLQGDYHLGQTTKGLIQELTAKNNFAYQIIPVFTWNRSVLEYHRSMAQLTNNLKDKPFDLFVVSSDSSLTDRYLVDLAKSLGAKVVVIYASVFFVKLFNLYRKLIGVDKKSYLEKAKDKVATVKNMKQRKVSFLNYFWWRVKWLKEKIAKDFKIFMNYYILPYIFSRRTFPRNKYDTFSHVSGRADTFICYNFREADAIRKVVIPAKDVRLAKHPAVLYCRSPKEATRKLLLLLGDQVDELRDDQISFWVEVIKEAVKAEGLNEVHFRFHPRTDKNLPQPKKLIASVAKLNLKTEIIDANTVPLVQILGDYLGVIGVLSGSLRTARAVSKGFVIGLLDACGNFPDEDWMLGDPEGIIWIRNGQKIQAEHFAVPPLYGEDRPKVSEILKELVCSQR